MALRDHNLVSNCLSVKQNTSMAASTFFRPPSITMTRNKVQDRVLHVFMNLIPAYAIDFVAQLQVPLYKYLDISVL